MTAPLFVFPKKLMHVTKMQSFVANQKLKTKNGHHCTALCPFLLELSDCHCMTLVPDCEGICFTFSIAFKVTCCKTTWAINALDMNKSA